DLSRNVIIPDNADHDDIVEKDGLPSTPQIKGFQAKREELSEEKPTSTSIVVRAESQMASVGGTTVMSELLDVPKLCDQCYLIDKCPHYQPNHTCYYRTAIKIEDSGS